VIPVDIVPTERELEWARQELRLYRQATNKSACLLEREKRRWDLAINRAQALAALDAAWRELHQPAKTGG